MIALPAPFIAYLRADGIVLPPEARPRRRYPDPLTPPASEIDSDASDDDDPSEDPSEAWRDLHNKVQDTIQELGGSVMPKLNWSAPKDATFMSPTNSMECRSANEVYLLLKSSDFVTHDLEQAWDGVDEDEGSDDDESDRGSRSRSAHPEDDSQDPPFHLVLRKTIPAWNPALEFRCFVRSRQLLCICQRDLNYFPFLTSLVPQLRPLIEAFHNEHLMRKFANADFVFDVYIPPPHDRVWLVDINPWAIRTDPLLFSWLELLVMPAPEQIAAASLCASVDSGSGDEPDQSKSIAGGAPKVDDDSDEDDADDIYTPEFRLVNRDDPEAYAFNTPKYSAHKMPKDVVDAGNAGEAGLRDFMSTWREVVKHQEVH